MKWILPCLMLIACFTLRLRAQQAPETRLENGQSAYQAENYAEAIEIFEGLYQTGYTSPTLLYNLGNAYYQTGDYARALLYYKRAERLAPKDPAIENNLRLAQEQLPATAIRIQASGVVELWRSVQNSLSARAWSVIGILLLWLGIGGFALWQFSPQRSRRKLGFILGLCLLALSLLPFAWAYGRAGQTYSDDEAILMVDNSLLRESPEPKSPDLRTVRKGEVVRILDRLGEWYRVQLGDTTEGWLPKDQLTVI